MRESREPYILCIARQIISHYKYISERVKYMRNTKKPCTVILILMMCS